MAGLTNIEWADAVWNPGREFTDVKTHPDRLDWPLRWRGSPQAKAQGRRSRIFVNSMSDLFHEDVSERFIKLVLRVAGASPEHCFQILTKRSKRMFQIMTRAQNCDFFGDSWYRAIKSTYGYGQVWKVLARPLARNWRGNIWLGVSIEDQATADERIPLLLQTPAAVRFVSYEPALGPVDLSKWLACVCGRGQVGTFERHQTCNRSQLDWVISGGESGPHARPAHPDWFQSVRDQCVAAGVPFFFKQWGEWMPIQYVNQHGEPVLKISVPTREKMRTSTKEIAFDHVNLVKAGKKSAGRLLDGREWNEFPE